MDTPFGRLGGLICRENYMPLARFHMYAQGVDLWIAPTLAIGDGWVATLQHLARENRMFVVGVNPVLHADQIPAAFPHREQLVPPGYLEENGPWLEEGNTVIIAPNGRILAGPVREKEETLIADLDLGAVLTGRRQMDPAGHYNRPDIFRLHVDTSARPAFVEHSFAAEPGTSPAASPGDLPNDARRRTPKPPHQVPADGSPIQLRALDSHRSPRPIRPAGPVLDNLNVHLAPELAAFGCLAATG